MRWVIFFLIFVAGVCQATEVFVSPTGDDGTGDGSRGNPYKTAKTQWAALSDGDILTCLAGTYDEVTQGSAANMTSLDPGAGIDNTTFRGDPLATAATVIFECTESTGPFISFNEDGTTLDGFTVKNHDLNQEAVFISGDDATVNNVIFDGCLNQQFNYDLEFSTVKGGTITNCSFINNGSNDYFDIRLRGDGTSDLDIFYLANNQHNSPADMIPGGADTVGIAGGINALNVDSLLIEGCVGWNSGGDETGLNHDFIRFDECDRAKVKRCRFYRNRKTAAGEIYVDGSVTNTHRMNDCDFIALAADANCDTMLVTECVVKGAGHGFNGPTTGDDMDLLTISYCVFDSTWDDGIFIPGTTNGATIKYNVLGDNGDNGIDVQGDNVTVTNNTVVRAWSSPILVQAAATTVAISRNIVYDRRDPASLVLVTETTGATSITWTENVYHDPDGSGVYSDQGSSRSFPEWQAQSNDVGGAEKDPKLWRPMHDPGGYIPPFRGYYSIYMGALRSMRWTTRRDWPGAYAPWER